MLFFELKLLKIHHIKKNRSAKLRKIYWIYWNVVPKLSLEWFPRDKRTGQGQKDKDKGQDIPVNRMGPPRTSSDTTSKKSHINQCWCVWYLLNKFFFVSIVYNCVLRGEILRFIHKNEWSFLTASKTLKKKFRPWRRKSPKMGLKTCVFLCISWQF